MIQQDFAIKLLKYFSLVTVGEEKKPNFTWTKNQTVKLTEYEFLKRYNYKGGIIKKDGEELTPTKNIGIITGFEDLECIDIDLKVFNTTTEKEEFWNEYLSLLKENIYDFDSKIVVYKTKNGGYHLIYKCKTIVGNKKIAKLKGHTEALIESRGGNEDNGKGGKKGFGYIFVYPENKVGRLTYFDVQYITEKEREIIWNISKAYDYKEPKPIEIPKEKTISKNKNTSVKSFEWGDLKPWDDFNNQTNIWDVISDEFSVVKEDRKKSFTLIKRHGSESAHSGYIYENNNCLFLFSTGTIYPAETPLSPAQAYTFKFHGGNFKEASIDLYEQGFGDRVQYKELEKAIIPKEKIEIKEMDFPIDIFQN
jgi:hypothetical protein